MQLGKHRFHLLRGNRIGRRFRTEAPLPYFMSGEGPSSSQDSTDEGFYPVLNGPSRNLFCFLEHPSKEAQRWPHQSSNQC